MSKTEKETALEVVGISRGSKSKDLARIAAVAERMEKVEKLLIKGESQHSIAAKLSAEYGVTKRQISVYIADVLNSWGDDAKILSKKDRISHRRTQLELVLEKALKANDLRAAVLVLDRLCKVDGVIGDDRQSHTHQHVHLHNGEAEAESQVKSMTETQKSSRLDQLLKLREEHLRLRNNVESNIIDIKEE